MIEKLIIFTIGFVLGIAALVVAGVAAIDISNNNKNKPLTKEEWKQLD